MLLEVRPGEGGDDAVVFANQLFKALLTPCKNISTVLTDTRTLMAEGDFEHLLPFVGTHRIQRIPKNDKRGRRHTSTATVAILAECSQNEGNYPIHDNDIVITTYRGSGPGGQHRNKTDTAVRIRHIRTGIVVGREESRSQWQNRQNALADLQRRLAEADDAQVRDTQQINRHNQIATGERPVKEFTHNQQRNETVDHSSGRRWRMSDFLRGRIS